MTVTENDEDISDYSVTIKIQNKPSPYSSWLYNQTLFPFPCWNFETYINFLRSGNNNHYNFITANDWAGSYYTGYWPSTYYDLYTPNNITAINPDYGGFSFLQVFTPSQPYNTIFYFSGQPIVWSAFAALSL